eukprot:15466248-Alexandrium_andersonii.AAC.1
MLEFTDSAKYRIDQCSPSGLGKRPIRVDGRSSSEGSTQCRASGAVEAGQRFQAAGVGPLVVSLSARKEWE